MNKKENLNQEKSEDSFIILHSDDEEIKVEVIDETVVNGETFYLVSEIKENDNEDDRECLVLKDISKENDEESTFIEIVGEEQEKIYNIFKKKLLSEDIILS